MSISVVTAITQDRPVDDEVALFPQNNQVIREVTSGPDQNKIVRQSEPKLLPEYIYFLPHCCYHFIFPRFCVLVIHNSSGTGSSGWKAQTKP